MASGKIIGLPWFEPATYAGVRAAMADAGRLPESYVYWLSSAESVEHALQASGSQVLRVEIEPERFLAWCRGQALAPDARARSAYAAEKATAQLTADR